MEVVVKTKVFATLSDGIVWIAVVSCLLSIPAFAQTRIMNAAPAFAIGSASPEMPSGTKVVTRVALNGQPVTRMYTQLEYGRTYLYIEHAGQPLTTVDISKKKNPQVVNHAPGNIEPTVYEQLFEGGSIAVTPRQEVSAGIDNLGGRGLRSILESSNPDDAKLLQAFGPAYANLACRDRRLVFFASPSQLVVVQDNRMTAIDFVTN